MSVKPIPNGYHTVTPFLVVPDINRQLAFIEAAFGATITERLESEDGSVLHAEARIGDSMLMLSPGKGQFQPMPCSLYLYVPDTDATYARALEAGASSVMEPGDQFYGDRNAGVMDQAGNYWWIATHFEDVSSEELQRRAQARAEQ